MSNHNNTPREQILEAENKRLKASNNKLRLDIIHLEHERQGRCGDVEEPDHVRDAMVKSDHLRGHIEDVESKHRRAVAANIELKNDRDAWRNECLFLREELAAKSAPAPTVQQDFASGSQSAHTYHQQHITNNFYVADSSKASPPVASSSGASSCFSLPFRPAADSAPASDVTPMDTDVDTNIKAPKFRDACESEANGQPCKHHRCRFFHQYQVKQFGHLRDTLPKRSDE